MKIFVKFNVGKMSQKVLEHLLSKYNVTFTSDGFSEIDIKERLSKEDEESLIKDFNEWGIDVVQNHKNILVQKIKDTINDVIFNLEDDLNVTFSVYLSEKLNHSYGYLANLFSEVTYTSIENYIIIQKIEYAKQLIITDNHTLTEIAYKLNYSSVAHLSGQFKKTTGITPSAFQRIIKKRKELTNL